MIPSIIRRSRFRRAGVALLLVACAAFAVPAQVGHAATINMSNLETLLSDPDNSSAKDYALWAGWMTQVYEYNMPFIELANGVMDRTIQTFRMTIGDTNYQFSNLFTNKQMTNSWDIPATGDFALLGKSTTGISFTSSIEDNGDTLVLDFGPTGLQPGEVVRFQVDIAQDPNVPGTAMYAPYNEVFFESGAGADTTGNSVVSLLFEGDTQFASATLPNYDLEHGVSLTAPRAYDDMQMIDVLPDLLIGDPIPEPGAWLLASIALLAGGSCRAKRTSV